MKRSKFHYLLALIIPMMLLTTLVIQNSAMNQKWPAAPLNYDTTVMSENNWLMTGQQMTVWNGMVGEPHHEVTALMTYGSYLIMIGEENTLLPRDTPILVYQAFGDVPELKMFGSGSGRKDTKGFTFVFNGATGEILHGKAHSEATMNISGAVLDLSFIPADTGPVKSLVQPPLPTLLAP
jgi:hypothetical protein